MLGLSDVIKNKSTSGLPFPMIFTGFFVGLSWLLYGEDKILAYVFNLQDIDDLFVCI